MSRNAYLEVYGQEPPANAHYGADISYWQDTSIWGDLVNWAEWVTIRCSYGHYSDDGMQESHVAAADAYGFQGKLGGYHFYYSGDPYQQANNYLYQAGNILDRFSHHMVDAEASPVADIGQLETCCNVVEQATGRPALIAYSGWSYLNQSGATSRPLWLPHYASSRYTAWNGTPGSWDTWNAPYTPDWYGVRNPAIWQFSSLTNTHGHLDLNVGTEELAQVLGLGQSEEEDMTPEQQNWLIECVTFARNAAPIINDINTKSNWLLDDTKTKEGVDLTPGIQIGRAADGIATMVRRNSRVRLIEVNKGWWITDLIGAVPVPSSEVFQSLDKMGYFNNDRNPDGSIIPQVWDEIALNNLIRYDLLKSVPIDPKIVVDAIKAALVDVHVDVDADAIAEKVVDEIDRRLHPDTA